MPQLQQYLFVVRHILRHIKLSILFFSFLSTQIIASGQKNTDAIDSFIAKLSWSSISMDCVATMLMLTHDDSTEKALIKIGKPATNKLIEALDDTSKTVIAHIILTQIWGTLKEKSIFSEKYIYKDCNQLIGTHYTYNGLVWEWYSGKEESIRPAEVQKIRKYWIDKLMNKKTVSLDLSQISANLEQQDKISYPCNKIYKNNSADVRYNDLLQLLDKKSDDELFKRLWNKFGNDSTVDQFDDCFFINYGAEGLSFRFEKDSLLSTVFVNEAYKGELPYKLKLTDRKPVVERKIGKPFKSGKYVDNTWGWYKEKSLHLDFDKNGKIIQFGISKI